MVADDQWFQESGHLRRGSWILNEAHHPQKHNLSFHALMSTGPNTPEDPALQPDGTLKDASELTWFHSPSDTLPIGVGALIVCVS